MAGHGYARSLAELGPSLKTCPGGLGDRMHQVMRLPVGGSSGAGRGEEREGFMEEKAVELGGQRWAAEIGRWGGGDMLNGGMG